MRAYRPMQDQVFWRRLPVRVDNETLAVVIDPVQIGFIFFDEDNHDISGKLFLLDNARYESSPIYFTSTTMLDCPCWPVRSSVSGPAVGKLAEAICLPAGS